MNKDDFDYGKWELYDAMDALMAYDHGATDSGIKDNDLKKAVKEFLNSLNEHDFRIILSNYVNEYYLSDEALAMGYGIEDVIEFAKWLSDELGICIC